MAMEDLRSPSMTPPGQPPVTPSGVPPQRPMPTSSAHAHSLSKKLLLLLVLLVVLLAALWLLSGNKMPLGDPYVDVAPKGEAVKNFPMALIPPGNPYIESSYSIAYKDAGEDFPVVTYTSTTDYEMTIDEFRRLLQADGWLILKDGSVDEKPMTNFYAEKGAAKVNIAIEDKEIGPWVVIAYSEPR